MPMQITTGAMMQCSFGVAPAALNVLPANRVLVGGMPAATIVDFAPGVNVSTFGMCSSMANPMVVAATAAALGVPTPAPCVPAPAAPWAPGGPTTLIGNQPALNSACTLQCLWGGSIQFVAPAQFTVQT